jgi:hypothetical protein
MPGKHVSVGAKIIVFSHPFTPYVIIELIRRVKKSPKTGVTHHK